MKKVYLYKTTKFICIPFKKSKKKKQYLANLNEKDITDNRKFWHSFKPFFFEKIKSRESIVLIKKGKTIYNEDEAANTLNTFFSNIVTNLNILVHHVNACHPRLSNHLTLKVILKYRNHSRINTIRCATKHLSSFYFSPSRKKH